jgi:hypothetical protein
MKQEQVVKAIKRAVGEHRQGAWCQLHGVNPTVLSDVLRGHKNPTEQLCALVGVERVSVTTTTYRKREDRNV